MMAPVYPVTSIFHSLQGEGHFVGYPMTFIRLAGCSVLDCHIRAECDEAPWKATERLSAPEIVAWVKSLSSSGIVCITGGEPTDHDLVTLLAALKGTGLHRVHIETSGSKSIDGMPFDWITVSPKVSGYAQRVGHTLKVVVRPEWGTGTAAWDHVHGWSDGTHFLHYYLQPLSGPDGTTNVAQVVDMLTGGFHNGGAKWALSTQAHKTWGVR